MKTELISEMLDLCMKLMQLITQEDIITRSLYQGIVFNMPLKSTVMQFVMQ
jgi:hypothetical protein